MHRKSTGKYSNSCCAKKNVYGLHTKKILIPLGREKLGHTSAQDVFLQGYSKWIGQERFSSPLLPTERGKEKEREGKRKKEKEKEKEKQKERKKNRGRG